MNTLPHRRLETGPSPEPSNSNALGPRKSKKKAKPSISDGASSASSNSSSSSQQGFKVSKSNKGFRVGSSTINRINFGSRDVENLGLHMGMSIAAFLSQVVERNEDGGMKMSAESMSKICIMAVRESLVKVSGSKYDNFVTNFEKSFQSTLMTLRLISESSQTILEKQQTNVLRESSYPMASTPFPFNTFEDSIAPSCSLLSPERVDDTPEVDSKHTQLVLHGGKTKQQLSIIEKSVMEQTRSNDLKALDIGLTMKKIQLKERQLSLDSDSNHLEKWKLSMGFSKATFKSEKFKTQLQEARQVELLKKCLDFLVSGLIMMLLSLFYGTYVFAHRRIIEVTEACSPTTGSKSWWMPSQVSSFNTGFQLLRCQVQALSRMLFGCLMIALITFLLIQRSATTHHTMPITFLVLLLGVACGICGKFCVDTLGGSGYCWLIYWEAICSLHFFANVFHSTLFIILNGPITVAERVVHKTMFPYWIRRWLFFTTLLVLPLFCGFMPFAGPREWIRYFSSRGSDSLEDLAEL